MRFLFLVIKKDGRREPFSRTKIFNGLMRACEKRPISVETLEEAVAEIEGGRYVRGWNGKFPQNPLASWLWTSCAR